MAGARVSGRRVYLSGPMTGIDSWNAKSFAMAHGLVKTLGARWVFDPSTAYVNWEGDQPSLGHEGFMRLDLHELTKSVGPWPGSNYYDLLLHLPGWMESDGCQRETLVAMACGIEVAELWEVELPCHGLPELGRFLQCDIGKEAWDA